jgi:hypothetical protein
MKMGLPGLWVLAMWSRAVLLMGWIDIVVQKCGELGGGYVCVGVVCWSCVLCSAALFASVCMLLYSLCLAGGL